MYHIIKVRQVVSNLKDTNVLRDVFFIIPPYLILHSPDAKTLCY